MALLFAKVLAGHEHFLRVNGDARDAAKTACGFHDQLEHGRFHTMAGRHTAPSPAWALTPPALLGHTSASNTETYAQQDEQSAIKAMEAYG